MQESLLKNDIKTTDDNGKKITNGSVVSRIESRLKQRKETGVLQSIKEKLTSFSPGHKRKSLYYEENIMTKSSYVLQHVLVFSGKVTRQLMESYKRIFDFPEQESSNIYVDLGKDLLVKADYRQAVVAFKKSLNMDSESKESFYYLGHAFYRLKDYKEAINAYLSAINANPEDASAHFELGLSYAGVEKYDQATKAYKKASELDPEDPEIHYCLGVSCDQMKDFRSAIGYFKQAIDLNPRISRYYHSLGFTYECIKQHDNAIECFKKAIELERERE